MQRDASVARTWASSRGVPVATGAENPEVPPTSWGKLGLHRGKMVNYTMQVHRTFCSVVLRPAQKP